MFLCFVDTPMSLYGDLNHDSSTSPNECFTISFGESTQQLGNLPQEKDETQVSTVLPHQLISSMSNRFRHFSTMPGLRSFQQP